MWKSFYENSELLELPLLGMFIFMATFVGAVFFGWRVKNDDPRVSLPLQDDDGRGEGSLS